MENVLKIGDIVKLNSGSPFMTLKSQDKELLLCVWYSTAEDKFKYEWIDYRLLYSAV